jgi:Pentatricopeptide repeat domain
MNQILTFTDVSDEVQELIDDISVKSSQGHWKAATRKLKKLSRRVGVDRPIPEETLMQVLNVCMANRLQGARASEPTRKVMEQLVENGYGIAEEVGNYCIKNCLSDTGPKSTHQGFGGIDTALAMKAALEVAGTPIQTESNYKIMIALAKEGSIESAIEILRKLVIDENDTPPLPTLVAFSQAIAMVKVPTDATKIVEVLGYVKAAGYDLDTIANVEDGRNLLANAIIAAERINNDSLGFRLLSAAGNVKLEETNERGDALVSNVSPITRRAAISIHRRTIVKSIDSGEWKVAVKVLELMVLRKLTPSPSLWRSVVTCCAKEGKSRKATALLLDWVKLYNKGEAEKPPLAVFNTVINACEICNEQELTLLVLDSMKSTHDTDGNLITFNIALKRLAKLGNYIACEGIVVGMLKAKVMPSVVTYTTAIAACVFKGNKQPGLAYEWLRRMRVQGINPNVMTYNTALAACLDTTLDSTRLASKIATEMLLDVDEQLQQVDVEFDEYRSVIPDLQTKDVARRLMQQLKQNWEAGDIEKRIAVESIRVPLLKLVDFQKSELGERARQLVARRADSKLKETEVTTKMELEIESLASHRFAEV